jgi:hypothetical protein
VFGFRSAVLVNVTTGSTHRLLKCCSLSFNLEEFEDLRRTSGRRAV